MPKSRRRKKSPPGKPVRPKPAAAPVTHLDFELSQRRASTGLRERFLASRQICLAERLAATQQEIDRRGVDQGLGFLLMLLYFFNFIREEAGPENADAVIESLAFTGWPLDAWRHLLTAASVGEMAAMLAAEGQKDVAGVAADDLKTLLLDAWESFGMGVDPAEEEAELLANARSLYAGIGGEDDHHRRQLVESLRVAGGPRHELKLHTLGIVPTELCPNSCRFCLVPLKLSLGERGAGSLAGDYGAEAAAFAVAKGLTLTITGGEPLLKPERVCDIISAARVRVELTTSGAWAEDDSRAATLLKQLDEAAANARDASESFDFLLQLSLDAFHQEVSRAGAGSYRENIPLENVARVVALVQTRFPRLKLALLGKYTRYPDPVAALLRLLEERGWQWRILKRSYHPGTTVSTADSEGRVHRQVALRQAWLRFHPPPGLPVASQDGDAQPVFLLYGQVENTGRATLLQPFEFPTHSQRTAAFISGGSGEGYPVTGLEVGDDGNVYPEAYAVQTWSLGNLKDESLEEICARAEYDPLIIALANTPARLLKLALALEPGFAAEVQTASSPMALVYAALRRPEMRLKLTEALMAGQEPA